MKISPHLLISLLFLVFSAHIKAELVDKIIVVVNDEVITQNEWNQEFDRIRYDFKQRGKQLPDNKAIRQQVLEKLILRSALMQKASEKNIIVTERQIQAALKRIASSNNLSLQDFRQALAKQDQDYAEFHQNVRNQLTIQQLQQRESNRLANVSEQEINAALAQTNWADNKEYHTAHILLPVPEAATPQQVTEQLNKINTLKQQLDDGADFNALAQEHSSGQQALEGGDLGWRKKHELPSLFVEPISHLKPGEYSKAIRSPSGFHILHLIEQRSANQVVISQTKARHILIKPDALQTEEEVVDKLNSLRDRILQGDDFAAIARANSVDHVSASQGGDLGWLAKGETVPAFDATMNGMAVGDNISLPFKSQFGWHIIQVMDRRDINNTESAQKAMVKNQLLKRKRQEALELWQKRLRDQAYVKLI